MSEQAVSISHPLMDERAETKRKALLFAEENPDFIRKYFELRRIRSAAQRAYREHMEALYADLGTTGDGMYFYQEFWLENEEGGSVSLTAMLDDSETEALRAPQSPAGSGGLAAPGESVTLAEEDVNVQSE